MQNCIHTANGVTVELLCLLGYGFGDIVFSAIYKLVDKENKIFYCLIETRTGSCEECEKSYIARILEDKYSKTISTKLADIIELFQYATVSKMVKTVDGVGHRIFEREID